MEDSEAEEDSNFEVSINKKRLNAVFCYLIVSLGGIPAGRQGTCDLLDRPPRLAEMTIRRREAGNHLCSREESNLRPFGPQPNALSTELRKQLNTS